MRAVFAAVIAVALAPGSDRTDSCKQATDRYNRIKAEVEAAVEVFATCLANSRGRDACVAEFDELDAVEARLEAVVGEHQETCP
jgi:predicted outer membrane protein